MIKNLSIVIPCKDDEKILIEKIPSLLKFCSENILEFEILIVTNGSNPLNIDTLNKFLNELGSNSIKSLSSNLVGKGAAFRKGLSEASLDNILLCDADFSVDITHLPKFFNDEGYPLAPFVTGSRKSKSSEVLESPMSRQLTGFVYTLLVKILLGIKADDTQCGFKLFNKKVFKNLSDFQTNGFSYDVELFLLADLLEIEFIEIPVRYIHENKSSISVIKDSKRMLNDLFLIRKMYRKNRKT